MLLKGGKAIPGSHSCFVLRSLDIRDADVWAACIQAAATAAGDGYPRLILGDGHLEDDVATMLQQELNADLEA